VSTEVLEGAMSDTATDTHRGQDTAQISEEYRAQLKEIADSQGWSRMATSTKPRSCSTSCCQLSPV
jgi:hypothetical protein